MIDFDVKTEGFAKAMEIAKLMTLPPNLKKRYLARVGRLVIAQAKKNVKEQKTVSGAPMDPRKRTPDDERPVYHRDGSVTYKKVHKSMLHDIVKGKFLRVEELSPWSAKLGFGRAGEVAHRHQFGGEQWFNMKMIKRFPVEDYDKKCNKEQAATLQKIGYMINGKRAPVALIMRMVTVGQAAAAVAGRKDRWQIKTPARPFLGANDQQISQFGDEIMNSLEERFRAKQHANLMV